MSGFGLTSSGFVGIPLSPHARSLGRLLLLVALLLVTRVAGRRRLLLRVVERRVALAVGAGGSLRVVLQRRGKRCG